MFLQHLPSNSIPSLTLHVIPLPLIQHNMNLKPARTTFIRSSSPVTGMVVYSDPRGLPGNHIGSH